MVLGILADFHGLPNKLREAIKVLSGQGVEKIIHLGDAVDTLRPETVDECISLLDENAIAGVMGNHEYSLVRHHFKRYPERFSEQSKAYVVSLPEVLVLDGICFTHFSPFGGVHGLFSPTDDANYEKIIQLSTWPAIINGHSHDPRIYRRMNGVTEGMRCVPGSQYRLEDGCRYILTCGALEDSYCATFDFVEREFQVVLVT